MSVQTQLENCLKTALNPLVLNVMNESHQHSGPGSETHFKVIAVAQGFEGQNRLTRHRMIHDLLQNWIGNPVHALSLQLFTPDEWAKREGQVSVSPLCRGGSKAIH